MTLEQTRAGFQTTHWTLLGQLGADDPQVRQQAMECLVRRYWPAVYAWLRRDGWSRDDAADAVQHFFADVVIGRHLFERTDQSVGRLRALVLTSLRRFLVDRHRRQRARGLDTFVSLQNLGREEKIIGEIGAATPDAAFERRWAMATLEEALRRCERHFAENGRGRHWTAFHARVLSPALGSCEHRPLTALAEELGFATPADVAAAVQVVKRRLLALLREVVAETTESPADPELEYQQLVDMLR
jgi:DNA-directed RNA polymerase specialized sigma24 family protein